MTQNSTTMAGIIIFETANFDLSRKCQQACSSGMANEILEFNEFKYSKVNVWLNDSEHERIENVCNFLAGERNLSFAANDSLRLSHFRFKSGF